MNIFTRKKFTDFLLMALILLITNLGLNFTDYWFQRYPIETTIHTYW